MAQVDTSIYSNLLRPPKSVEEYDQEAMQTKSNQLSMLLQKGQYDQMQRGVADDQAYRDAAKTFGADTESNYNALLQRGLVNQAQGYKKSALDNQKTGVEIKDKQADTIKKGADTEKVQFETALNKQKAIAELAGTATDQASWTRAKTLAQAIGADVSQIPDQFDPMIARQLADTAVSQVQRIEQALKERQFGETVRNNKAQTAVSMRGQDITRENNVRSNARMAANGSAPAKPAKPLPVGALKMQQEAMDAIGTAGGINADLGAVLGQLDSGALQLGPVKNIIGQGRNMLGMSDQNSKNLASFRATIEKLRNDSLRLNKGVQTDGDAQRAWNELLDNINDPGVVKQRLLEIQALNQRAVEAHEMNLDMVRSNYGAGEVDTTSRSAPKPAIGAGVKTIKTDADYNALPSGATFVGPDGKTRRKP